MKRSRAMAAGLLLCLLLGRASAETLTLPQGLTEVAEESFAGCGTIEAVVAPSGVRRLGARAFAGCGSLRRVTLPQSVEAIGTDCFADCGEALLVECAPDSAAHAFALENGLDYDADTVCRALVIGQGYSGTSAALQGPPNDARAMRFMLANQAERPFSVSQRSDLTAQEILDSAASAFAGATEEDISLFYYSGHGVEGGELVGVDMTLVTPAALRSVLDEVPGRKVLIIDACYSGQWVSTASTRSAAQDFNTAFLAGFLGNARSAAAGEYFIITSARSTELCVEMNITSGSLTKVMGCFTYALCRGCGWDGVTSRSTDLAADANGDRAVSVAEAYRYAYTQAMQMFSDQHAQTNAGDCRAFAPFR